MITIHELPALRLLIALIAGIILAPYIDLSDTHILTYSLLSVVTASVLLYFLRARFQFRFIGTIFQLLIGIFISCLMLNLTDETKSLHHVTRLSEVNDSSKVELIATCTDAVSHKKFFQIPLEINGIKKEDSTHYKNASGKVIIFVKDLHNVPQPGDQLHITSILQTPATSSNPNAFDYGAYLARQKIFKTGFAKIDEIQIVRASGFWNIKNFTLKLRDWLLQRTALLIGDNEVADVSNGLLFGYRDKIDDTTEKQFVNSGAVHLLAVSGMHVILIFTNFRWLLRCFKIHKILSDKWVSIISIVMIWLFSFLVGLAPSIVRATIMLSLVIGGELIRKQSNTLNLVCAGAIIMLVYDPMTIWDVGFQLSFAAVIGILQLQKPIRNLLPAYFHKSKTLVDLISVTCAAQIGTLPLILFYFHQFPVYFLITGIVAVVISDYIIKIGFGIIIISVFSLPLAEYFSLAWYWSAAALVKSIEWINRLPNVLIDRIYFDLPMAILTSLLIIILIIHLSSPIRIFKKIFVSGILLLLLLDLKSILLMGDMERVTVYSNKKSRMIEIQNGFNSIVIVDEGLNDKAIQNNVLGNQVANNVKSSKVIRISNEDNAYFSFGGKDYLLPNAEAEVKPLDGISILSSSPQK